MSVNQGRTCIVIPCYNEERRLDVAALRTFICAQTDVDLLIVDDCSTDGTVAVAERLTSALGPRVTLLRQPRNAGKGEAVRAGMLQCIQSAYTYTGFWDADLATPLSAIHEFLAVIQMSPQYRWVIGARVRLLGRVIDRNAFRHYAGRMFATGASLALGLAVYDTQCGAKLFRADSALAGVLRDPFLSRWLFDVEMIARLKSIAGIPVEREIVELPLREWRDVSGSKVTLPDFVRSGIDLLRVWLHYRVGSSAPATAAQREA